MKIGVVMPMTGGLSAIGRQVKAGIDLFMQSRTATKSRPQGSKCLLRDDGGQPEKSQRIGRRN